MDDELALTPTDDILDELASRFDDFAFIGRKFQGDELPYIVHRRQDGDVLAVIGLLHSMASVLCDQHEGAGEPPEGDESED